jgi:hypothetical protein
MLSVMCCGCLRLLGKDNRMLGERDNMGGAIDIAGLTARFAPLRESALSFPTKEECDKAALSAGWTVADPDGTPNHRCPDCRLPDSWTPGGFERSGAYIDWGLE